MRLQSATQREHPFPAGQLLVSPTDLKERILHHPDMPEEAFRDLWVTIQAGQSGPAS